MEQDITLVTAFFDIGRKDFKSYSRNNNEYFEYFKVWSKMKNKLVIYTNSEMAKKVKKYREEYGLLNRTTIIEINDEENIEKEIFEKMKKISNDKYFLTYRYIMRCLFK